MKTNRLFLLFCFMVYYSLSKGQCPQANFTSTAPACQGSSINFTNTSGNTGGGWTYFWDFDYPNGGGSSPATSTNQNPTNVNYTPGGNGVYTVAFTITNAGMGCSSTVLIDIDIRTARADFIASSQNICVDDSVIFYNNGTPGSSSNATVTHSWSFGLGAVPSTSSSVNPLPVTYTTSGLKTVNHFVTVNYGACGGGTRTDLFTQDIIVNAVPLPSLSSTAPVCAGQSVDFTYTGGGGNTFFWNFGAGASPQNSTAQNPGTIIYSTSGTKIITLQATNAYGCSKSVTQNITINTLPLADAGMDTTICANTSVQIGSSSIGGNTYNWFPSNTLNNSSIADPASSPIAPVTTYFVTVTDGTNGCVNQDTVNVTMLAPLLADAGIDQEICQYDSIQIGAALIEGQDYSWSPSAGLSSTISPNPISNTTTTITYTLSVTGNGCGPETDEVTVVVHPLPLAYAGSDDSITNGSSVQLSASGGVQYYWQPSIGLDNVGIYNPFASPDTTTQYIVQVTDIYGCVNFDTLVITVIVPSFWLPNAFTPNNDNSNDVLYVRGEGVGDFEFGIFNRWGEQLFFSKDMNFSLCKI